MMIRRCLIVDVETGGTDPTKDPIVEIGAALYSVEHQTTIAQFSRLMPAGRNAAQALNGIPSAALGDDLPDVGGFDRLIECADVFVAHNAAFDSAFLSRWREHPWVCTMDDFTWPRQTKPGMSLVSLALAHGIGVMFAHRALNDCQLIAALFDRMDDLQSMFARAMRPRYLFRSFQPFEMNESAKAHGFQWNKEDHPLRLKAWTAWLVPEDIGELPFKIQQIGGPR